MFDITKFFKDESEATDLLTLTLHIKVENTHVASITWDESTKVFELLYLPIFSEMGLLPFHEIAIEHLTNPNFSMEPIRSPELWGRLADLLPSPERPDFAEALASANLNENDNELKLLAGLSSSSASKPWSFELAEAA